MSNGSDEKMVVRPADLRGAGQPYEDGLIARARLVWCLEGGGLEGVRNAAEKCGVEPTIVDGWKRRMAPDGLDWEAYRQRLGLAEGTALTKLVRVDSEWEMYASLAARARDVLVQTVTALDQGELYSRPRSKEEKQQGADLRQPVTALFTKADKRVKVSPLRPQSLGEASRVMKTLTDMVDVVFERLDGLDNVKDAVQAAGEKVLIECLEAAHDLFGADGMNKLRETLGDRRSRREETKVEGTFVVEADQGDDGMYEAEFVPASEAGEFGADDWEDESEGDEE